MGLKENFSQAVKELTGNTKEDDKKRNAQVAGLKKALGDEQPFSDDSRFVEGASRPYYRGDASQNGQNYDNRGDFRRENAVQGETDRDGRNNYGERGDFAQNSSQPRDVNYRDQGRYDDGRGYDRRADYGSDRGYEREPAYDGRNDGYDRQPSYNDDRGRAQGDNGYSGQNVSYDGRQQGGYDGQRSAYDNRQDGGYDSGRDYDNRQQNGGYDSSRRDYDNRQDGSYDNARRDYDNRQQNGSYDGRQQNGGYDSGRDYDGRRDGGYDNNRRDTYDNRQNSGRDGADGGRENRNYNVRNFGSDRAERARSYSGNGVNQSQSYGRNYDGQRNTYPMGTVNGQRNNRDNSDNELTVISRNTIIDGNVRSFANMSIDGDIRGDVETTKDIDLNGRIIGDIICSNANMMVSQVQGNIQLKGDVEIGRDTLLIGDLNSGFAKINGKVKGNVEVTGKAEFKADAVVFGDISASTITVDDGAIIQGYVSTTFLNKEESDRIFPDAIEIGE